MEQTLREMVAKIAETTQDFAPGANLKEDLNLDSVRLIELFFEIEHGFQVQLPQGGLVGIRTFDDLLAFVKSLKQ